MPIVYRYPLMPKCWNDTGALPCPRCRSTSIKHESHPATGPMETCLECGGRSDRESWNDGVLRLDRDPKKPHQFKHNGGIRFVRPPSDKIVRTTRAKALRLVESEEPKHG